VVAAAAARSRWPELAEQLGYASHSPVSKRLEQIRWRAEEFFGLDEQ
jgi:hypothetical protein